MKQFIQIQAQDNVAVALQNLSAGTVIHLADKEIILKQDIPRGHKFAVKILPHRKTLSNMVIPLDTLPVPLQAVIMCIRIM